jgi:hypothetical protein
VLKVLPFSKRTEADLAIALLGGKNSVVCIFFLLCEDSMEKLYASFGSRSKLPDHEFHFNNQIFRADFCKKTIKTVQIEEIKTEARKFLEQK